MADNKDDSYNSYNMFMYSRFGNTSEAYDYAALPAERPRPVRTPDRKARRKRGGPSYEFVKDGQTGSVCKKAVTVALFSLLAICSVATYAGSLLIEKEITQKTALYESVVNANSAAKFSMEQSIDLDHVALIATAKLGMRKPEEYQKVFINVPKQSHIVSYGSGVRETPYRLSLEDIFSLLLKN